MTSEVVLLNKDAVIIAADSAVTVSHNPHPRYSKNANKIFDISRHGNVAVTIFSSAEIDRVPWELALKMFRQADALAPQRALLTDYVPAVMDYLENNRVIFPQSLLDSVLETKLIMSVGHVIKQAVSMDKTIEDDSIPLAQRQSTWSGVAANIKNWLDNSALAGNLTQANFDDVAARAPTLANVVTVYHQVNAAHTVFDVGTTLPLAVQLLFKQPSLFLDSMQTGMVFAGYGSGEIFPSFKSILVYGFIGKQIAHTKFYEMAIKHDSHAWIQPFAQSSMIERFTDGFDYAQQQRLSAGVHAGLNSVVDDLIGAGITIPPATAVPIVTAAHQKLMDTWRNDNWNANFYPLRSVLNNLSVQEMAHLAETLLVLESLRERVTSPSESVGGPVDVAAITKAEGLVWIKRKHYFDSALNLRYLDRQQRG